MMGVFESAASGKRVLLPQKDRGHPLLRWRTEFGLGKFMTTTRCSNKEKHENVKISQEKSSVVKPLKFHDFRTC